MLDALTNDLARVRAPDYVLRLDGRDITPNFSDRLISLTMTDNRSLEADELTIELDDSDGRVELPTRGERLTLFLGWKGQSLTGKGDFTVDRITHAGAPDRISLHASSADIRGSLNSRREQAWHGQTLGAIADAIAARNHLTASVVPALANIIIPHIDQSQESDAKFLTRLAGRNGGEVSIKAGKLLMLQAGRRVTASSKPIQEITIARSEGDRHEFSIADRFNYTGVTAKWLDTKDPKQQQRQVSTTRKFEKPSSPAQQHPQAQQAVASGGAASQKAQQTAYMVGEPDNVFAMTTTFPTQAEAIRAAQAKWESLQRGAAELSLNLAMGRADIYPEMPVRLTGFKPAINQQPWIITRVVHSLSARGFVTTLTLEVDIAGVEYEISE
ncbi:phage late control D family protein [Erwinia sp. 9145]|uniref:phage late control D family protein n=1 Tax=Erwinia sp. 9145 TaxID=1500895 RepID=UPI00054F4F0D|nr:phage late control D family protein [Erwinia sp. 9145]